jgi:aspartyl protease family protein
MHFDSLNSNELANFIYLSILLVALISSITLRNHQKISTLLKQFFIWLLIALFSIIIYSYRHSLYQIAQNISSELVPSEAKKIGDRKIAIKASNNGHFYVQIKINKVPIRFMVDTGASDISMTIKDAKKANINTQNLSHFKQYQTANGVITGAISNAKEVEIAGMAFKDVAVSINQSQMETSLLGMSFLRKFKKYEFYQDQLILTY